jgi:hypothetical protein
VDPVIADARGASLLLMPVMRCPTRRKRTSHL